MANQKISARTKISSLAGNEKIPLGVTGNQATDADQLAAFANTIIRDGVPTAGDTLNKLYNLISGNAHFRGTYASLAALQSAVPTGNAGDYAFVDTGGATDTLLYIWDDDDSDWVLSGGGIVPDASSSVKGIAKLYTSLGSNTDGAVDQNTVNDRFNNVSFLKVKINLTSHGFVVGDNLWLNGSGVLAKITNPNTQEWIGIVSDVDDANNFRLTRDGYIQGLSGLTSGTIYYAQTTGALGTTKTAIPVLKAIGSTTAFIIATAYQTHKFQGWTIDPINQKLTLTGVDTSGSSTTLEIQNSALLSIIKILNNQTVEFGGNSAFWTVATSIASNNAGMIFNNNQAKSFVFKNANGDEFMVMKTTTGDLSVRLKQKIEYDQGKGFVKFLVQSLTVTTTTAGAWNNLYQIDLSADQAVSISVDHLFAYATDRSAATAYGAKNGLVKRDNANNTTASVPTFTLIGGAGTEAWRIAADDVNERATVDFQNSTGTGKTYTVMLDMTYIKQNLPS